MKFDLLDFPRTIFGPGRLAEVGREIKATAEKALLVTGREALRRSGGLDRCLRSLESAGVSPVLFDRVEPEPGFDTVDSGAEEARRAGVGAVIGLGGGSAMDAAKAIAFLADKGRSVRDYYCGLRPEAPGLPFTAIPTTAGTGAEVTQNSVLTDPSVPRKESLRGRVLMARLVLLDPELTLTCPAEVTAYAGMDALTQALEALVSGDANPFTDALALRAVALIGPNLKTAVDQGDRLPARESLLLGSFLAGAALTNAHLGAVHGLAHPVGSGCGIPHGIVCALLLPHVIRFNGPDDGPLGPRTRDKYRQALGLAFPELPPSAAGAAWAVLADRITSLIEQIGIDRRLRDYGASRDDFPGLARLSLPSGSLKANPRSAGVSDLMGILEAAY